MKKVLLIALAALALGACGKGRSNPAKAAGIAAQHPELQGSWQSDCVFGTNLNAYWESAKDQGPIDALKTAWKSVRTEYVFRGNTVYRSEFWYKGEQCNGESVTFTQTGSVDHLGAKEQEQGQTAGRNIDIHFTEVRATPKTADGVNFANSSKLCGITDWQEGKEANINTQSNKGNCYRYPADRRVYNVYRVDGNKLYLSDQIVANKAEERPKDTVTRLTPFTKKP